MLPCVSRRGGEGSKPKTRLALAYILRTPHGRTDYNWRAGGGERGRVETQREGVFSHVKIVRYCTYSTVRSTFLTASAVLEIRFVVRSFHSLPLWVFPLSLSLSFVLCLFALLDGGGRTKGEDDVIEVSVAYAELM